MNSRNRFVFFLILAVLLYACSTSAKSQLVSSNPSEKPIATYPGNSPAPANLLVVHNATLELAVSNPDKAVDQATDLVNEFRGYLVSSHTWFQDKDIYITMVLAVPVSQFELLRQSLLKLGSLKSENVSGDLVPFEYGTDGWSRFSHITLHLQPKGLPFPDLTAANWRPVQTFSKAWSVFVTIFGFLADIAIWIVVVGGPFILLGWITFVLVRRKVIRS